MLKLYSMILTFRHRLRYMLLVVGLCCSLVLPDATCFLLQPPQQRTTLREHRFCPNALQDGKGDDNQCDPMVVDSLADDNNNDEKEKTAPVAPKAGGYQRAEDWNAGQKRNPAAAINIMKHENQRWKQKFENQKPSKKGRKYDLEDI